MRQGASFDVLVVGSGAAGLAAAVSAERAGARVGVATKTTLQACNSAKAQGGIQASFGDDDSPEIHAEDVMRSSHDTADPKLVQILTSEAPSAIHWLEELGVEFTRQRLMDRMAKAIRSTAAIGSRAAAERPGSACSRSATGPGTRSRRLFATPTRPAAARSCHITRCGRSTPSDGGWVASFETKEGAAEVEAATVVLAAGGRCFAEAETRGELSTNHPNATGEVTRIALDAGAQTRDLDALQYHPNGGAWPSTMQGYSIPETTRAYGAVLRNADGDEFTDSLGARDAVSAAIVDEVEKGKGVLTPDGRPAVWLDTTRISPEDAEISLPYMLRRYRGAGIDPLAEPIYTYPVLHYQNGGLVIDEHAETTLEGVFACGEIAGGTHGRNRMMGNSLLECTVFGRRAGKAAAERARA